MADGTGPDWTAITQAVAAVVQAGGAVLTLIAAYNLAKRSHEEATRREAANDARRERQQQEAAHVLLANIAAEAEVVHQAIAGSDAYRADGARQALIALIERSYRTQIDCLDPESARAFLQGVAAGARCVSLSKDKLLGVAPLLAQAMSIANKARDDFRTAVGPKLTR